MRTAFFLSVVFLLFGTIGCSETPSENMASTDSPAEVSVEGEGMPGEDLMRGLFIYMADAALFEDCASGQRYPVAMEADYISAERAYLEARSEPGAPLLVSFEGRLEPRPPMEGDGVVEMIVIDRFDAAHPGEDCGG